MSSSDESGSARRTTGDGGGARRTSRSEPSERAASPASLRVRSVIETTLCCNDLDAAEDFYTGVLGFETWAKDAGRHLFFRCGDAMLLLFNPDHTATNVTTVGDAEIPLHGTRGAGHVAFRATWDEIEGWKERLAAHDVAVDSVVDWPEGGHSIFFRDPDGNCLEFTTPNTWGLEDR